MYKRIVKPALDILSALMAVIAASPVLLIFGILLAINNRGSLFFTQLRPGKNGRLFKVIKFKTMTDRKDAHGNLLPDAARLTTVGKLVRKTSLDELPQLINVIIGDMSIVGPRPLLLEYLELYTPEQARRHVVKPGITGWAQVNGRNAISWQEKFKLDVWYVNHQSFMLDLKILIKTVKKVFISEGIAADGHVTTTKFEGN